MLILDLSGEIYKPGLEPARTYCLSLNFLGGLGLIEKNLQAWAGARRDLLLIVEFFSTGLGLIEKKLQDLSPEPAGTYYYPLNCFEGLGTYWKIQDLRRAGWMAG